MKNDPSQNEWLLSREHAPTPTSFHPSPLTHHTRREVKVNGLTNIAKEGADPTWRAEEVKDVTPRWDEHDEVWAGGAGGKWKVPKLCVFTILRRDIFSPGKISCLDGVAAGSCTGLHPGKAAS